MRLVFGATFATPPLALVLAAAYATVEAIGAIGVAESKDLADAYIAYFTMHARLLQANHDWNIAVVQLRRAAGMDPLGPSS